MASPESSSMLFARLAMPVALVLAAGIAAFAIADQMAADRAAADRRALIARNDELTARAIAPGSSLSCLDAAAGDATESACEAAVFASPHATAAAVAYVGARLSVLADAKDMPALASHVAVTRRAIELDRFGVAAHVLSERDGCSASQCGGFGLVTDSSMLRANLKAHTFDQYVSRHAAGWTGTAAPTAALQPTPQVPAAAPQGAMPPPAVSQVPAEAKPVVAVTPPSAPPPLRRPSAKYDFPSASAIPPVSIMAAEPALPKETTAKQPEPAAADRTPVPPRRPQASNEAADTPAPR